MFVLAVNCRNDVLSDWRAPRNRAYARQIDKLAANGGSGVFLRRNLPQRLHKHRHRLPA
jgi:hypothetical protein